MRGFSVMTNDIQCLEASVTSGTIREVRKFIAAHYSERITAQASVFTVHPSPATAMTSNHLEKIVILQEFRKVMKDMLFKYGIHRATLFPGLDGLADHISWLHVESHSMSF